MALSVQMQNDARRDGGNDCECARAIRQRHPHNLFSDDKAIPAWAKSSVEALKKLGIVKGIGAGEFNPSAQTTRAEAVNVLMNMLGQSK